MPAGTLANRPPQPFTFVYGTNMTGVGAYAAPGGLVVAGRANYNNPAFHNVSAAGGTVLIYLDAIIDNDYGTWHQLLHNTSTCGPAVPRWPGEPNANQWGYLADFRPGSILQFKLECVLEAMVAANPHMGGFFMDDVGSRSWFGGFNWSTFGTANQQAYRDGAIQIVNTARTVADRHGLIVIVNGTWNARTSSDGAGGGGYPNTGQHGNASADGFFIENHPASELSFWTAVSTSPQWATGSPYTRGVEFMLVGTRTVADRDAYINSGNFAFVQAYTSGYETAVAPWGPLHPTGLPTGVS